MLILGNVRHHWAMMDWCFGCDADNHSDANNNYSNLSFCDQASRAFEQVSNLPSPFLLLFHTSHAFVCIRTHIISNAIHLCQPFLSVDSSKGGQTPFINEALSLYKICCLSHSFYWLPLFSAPNIRLLQNLKFSPWVPTK